MIATQADFSRQSYLYLHILKGYFSIIPFTSNSESVHDMCHVVKYVIVFLLTCFHKISFVISFFVIHCRFCLM